MIVVACYRIYDLKFPIHDNILQKFLSYYPCCKHNKGFPYIVSFYFDIICFDLWLNLFDHDLCGSEIIKGRSLTILLISRHDEYK